MLSLLQLLTLLTLFTSMLSLLQLITLLTLFTSTLSLAQLLTDSTLLLSQLLLLISFELFSVLTLSKDILDSLLSINFTVIVEQVDLGSTLLSGEEYAYEVCISLPLITRHSSPSTAFFASRKS